MSPSTQERDVPSQANPGKSTHESTPHESTHENTSDKNTSDKNSSDKNSSDKETPADQNEKESQTTLQVFAHNKKEPERITSTRFKDIVVLGNTLIDLRNYLVGQGLMKHPIKSNSDFCDDKGATVSKGLTVEQYFALQSQVSNDATGNLAVYFQTKSRVESSTPEVNLDLSTKAAGLPTAQIQRAASSYQAADWAASAGDKDVVHPADMSERHWNIVMRQNSLMSGFRPVYKEIDKKTKFVSVERAIYSAFAPKQREFLDYEASFMDQDEATAADRAQQILCRIPRYLIDDDSYVRVFETKSSVEESMSASSLTDLQVEASGEYGAVGFSAAVKAGFKKSSQASGAKASAVDTQMMHISYNFPRVVLFLDHDNLDLSAECKRDIDAVDSTEKLLEFYRKYGYWFPTRVRLGGRLFSSDNSSTVSGSSVEEKASAMKAAASISFKSPNAKASVDTSYETQENKQTQKTTTKLARTLTWQAKGGDTLLCNNPPDWCSTVGSFYNWRVVENDETMLIRDIIGTFPGLEGIPKKFEMLEGKKESKDTIQAPAKKQVKFSLRNEGTYKYLKVDRNINIMEIMAKIGPDPLPFETILAKAGFRGKLMEPEARKAYLKNNYPEAAKFMENINDLAKQGSHHGVTLQANQSDDMKGPEFGIEVDDTSGGTPKIYYGHRYDIKFGEEPYAYLSSTPTGQFFSTSLLCGHSKASGFGFKDPINPTRTDAIENGALVELVIYNEAGQVKGVAQEKVVTEKDETDTEREFRFVEVGSLGYLGITLGMQFNIQLVEDPASERSSHSGPISKAPALSSPHSLDNAGQGRGEQKSKFKLELVNEPADGKLRYLTIQSDANKLSFETALDRDDSGSQTFEAYSNGKDTKEPTPSYATEYVIQNVGCKQWLWALISRETVQSTTDRTLATAFAFESGKSLKGGVIQDGDELHVSCFSQRYLHLDHTGKTLYNWRKVAGLHPLVMRFRASS